MSNIGTHKALQIADQPDQYGYYQRIDARNTLFNDAEMIDRIKPNSPLVIKLRKQARKIDEFMKKAVA